MIGRLRRIRCTNWPMPIAPVSPSPLTPIAISLLFASMAPVPTDGIRPWTALNPCDPPRKYAGLLLQQPRVTVLLDDVHAIVHVDELHEIVGEGIRAEPVVRRLEVGLLAELVAALADRPVRGAVADEANLRVGHVLDDRPRHPLARR